MNYLESFKELYELIGESVLWCFVEEFHRTTFVLGDLPSLYEEIRSSDLRKQHLGVIGLREALDYQNHMQIQQMIDANIVPRLIEFLEMDDFPYLQYESAWILADWSMGYTIQIRCIVDNGGILSLIKLLDSKYPHVLEQVIKIISTILSFNIK